MDASPPTVRGPGVPAFIHALQRGDPLAWLAIVIGFGLLLLRLARRR